MTTEEEMTGWTFRDKLRRVILSPYRKGMGPRFELTMWATRGTDSRGCTTIAYRLIENDFAMDYKPVILFEGADFHGSLLDADDSDATVAGLLAFLTLRPGDTDDEYFADYTARQIEFCEQHAEALGNEAIRRFGEI